MSKTTRPSKKAAPKTSTKLSSPTKEKTALKKSTAATSTPRKQAAVPSRNSIKKTAVRPKAEPVAAVKTLMTASEEMPSRVLRQTKTTGSALAHLEKGIEFLYRKDFKKAHAELQSLVDNYPNDLEISARARSYLDICTREEIRQRKTVAPTDQLYAMGVLEHNKANYDKAIAYFRQSLEKHPKADYIYYSLAASLARKGELTESIENLRKAVTLNKDSRVHAKNDSDFLVLGGHRDFQDLIGMPANRQP